MKQPKENEFVRTALPACMALALSGGMVRLYVMLAVDTLTDKVIGWCMQWVCVVSARHIGSTIDLSGFDGRDFDER